jgi:hypothetical protein
MSSPAPGATSARRRMPTRRQWYVLTGVVLLVYGASGGCYAQRLPAALGPAERELLAQAPLPYAVAVVPWEAKAGRGLDPTAYARGTLDWLEGSGAFASVQLDAAGAPKADLTATSIGAYCNTAAIPLFTILSLGLIPTVFTDTDCEGAVFRVPRKPAGLRDSVVVRYQQDGRVVMGWLAMPLGALPGWTHGSATTHHRGRERSRLALLTEREALVGLVGR